MLQFGNRTLKIRCQELFDQQPNLSKYEVPNYAISPARELMLRPDTNVIQALRSANTLSSPVIEAEAIPQSYRFGPPRGITQHDDVVANLEGEVI